MQLLLYILMYPLIILVSVLPFRILYFFSDVLYFFMYRIFGYRKHTVRENLSLAFPNKTLKERREIEKRFYKHFSDLFVEMIKAFHMPLSQIQRHFIFKNADLINKITDKNQSVIIVGGHFANWEWVFSLAQLTNIEPIATYLKINNRYFERLMLKNRQRFGGKLIETKNLRNYLQDLKKQKKLFVLGLLADQSPQLHRSRYWRNYFDIEVPVFVGPENLAKEYETGFVFMYINKIKRGFYEVEFEQITTQPTKYEDYKLTDEYFKRLEKQIKNAPQFYLWTHRRFKHKDRKQEVVHLLKNI